MSGPSTTSVLDPDGVRTTLTGALTQYDALFRPLEAMAFWAAVALPFVYLPLLVTGLDTTAEAIAVAALVTAHVLALVLGHRYRSDD